MENITNKSTRTRICYFNSDPHYIGIITKPEILIYKDAVKVLNSDMIALITEGYMKFYIRTIAVLKYKRLDTLPFQKYNSKCQILISFIKKTITSLPRDIQIILLKRYF